MNCNIFSHVPNESDIKLMGLCSPNAPVILVFPCSKLHAVNLTLACNSASSTFLQLFQVLTRIPLRLHPNFVKLYLNIVTEHLWTQWKNCAIQGCHVYYQTWTSWLNIWKPSQMWLSDSVIPRGSNQTRLSWQHSNFQMNKDVIGCFWARIYFQVVDEDSDFYLFFGNLTKNLKGYGYDSHCKVYKTLHKHKEALVSKLRTFSFIRTSLPNTRIHAYQSFGCGYLYQIVGIFIGQVCCFQLYMDILNNNLGWGDHIWCV